MIAAVIYLTKLVALVTTAHRGEGLLRRKICVGAKNSQNWAQNRSRDGLGSKSGVNTKGALLKGPIQTINNINNLGGYIAFAFTKTKHHLLNLLLLTSNRASRPCQISFQPS